MDSLWNLFDGLIQALNQPEMRALALVFSAASLGISIWLFRKTTRVLDTQRRHIVVDQTRFIDDMWQQSNALVLSDDRYIRVVKELFGYESEEDVIRTFMIFNIINPLYVNYRTMKEGATSRESFEANRDNILSNYSGDRPMLLDVLRTRGYTADFVQVCEEFFRLDQRRQKSAQSPGVGSAHQQPRSVAVA